MLLGMLIPVYLHAPFWATPLDFAIILIKVQPSERAYSLPSYNLAMLSITPKFLLLSTFHSTISSFNKQLDTFFQIFLAYIVQAALHGFFPALVARNEPESIPDENMDGANFAALSIEGICTKLTTQLVFCMADR